MMELKMTLKEADRLHVMKRLISKQINLKKAAEELGLSYKQTCRITKRYREKGVQGLISRKRGKPSNHHLDNELIQKALSLIKANYPDYGPTLVKEKLEEKHSIKLAKETLRQLMIKAGLWLPKTIKQKRVYARRTRRSRMGELEQIDGSYEYWFEDRGEKCCLLVCVDDATSKHMHLRFCRTETTQDYLQFLKDYIKKYGRPLAFYSDKHSIFRVNHRKRLEGAFSTQFQAVLKKLDIELICAHSPQAKGRVERANGILQDRLIKELREMGISTIEEGNEFLEKFRLQYNKKFGVEPSNSENAHRSLLPHHNLEHLCMIEEERVLSKDLSFQYKTELYQIDSEFKHRLYGKKVQIYEVDGEIRKVIQNGKELKFKKWKEKECEPTRIIDTKDLETLWPMKKGPNQRHHPWRQGNFFKKVDASSP
jgi:transposase